MAFLDNLLGNNQTNQTPPTFQSLYSQAPVGGDYGLQLGQSFNAPSSMSSYGYQGPDLQFTGLNNQGGFLSRNGSTIMGGLNAAAGLLGAYNGMQQNKLVKQQMATSIAQWDKNYNNQVSTYNTQLEDRQRARNAASSTAESTDSYMNRNRLK